MPILFADSLGFSAALKENSELKIQFQKKSFASCVKVKAISYRYLADSFSAGIDLGINIDFVQTNHGGALENLVKFTGKTCVEVSFKIKLQASGLRLY